MEEGVICLERKTSQVTFVTLVPRGNKTLRPETLRERHQRDRL